MNEKELSEIEDELENISPWPWKFQRDCPEYAWRVCKQDGSKVPDHDQDLPFIAKAPERIAALVKMVRELEEKVDMFIRISVDAYEKYHTEKLR